jgi:hypothetical protein
MACSTLLVALSAIAEKWATSLHILRAWGSETYSDDYSLHQKEPFIQIEKTN